MVCNMYNRDGSVTAEDVPPCARCGFCCLSVVCPVGVLAFGPGGPGAGLGFRVVGLPAVAGGPPAGEDTGGGAVSLSRSAASMADDVAGPCPGLSMSADGVASCVLLSDTRFVSWWYSLGVRSQGAAAWVLGCGSGCCVKARVFVAGKSLDFASLCDSDKQRIVKLILAKY